MSRLIAVFVCAFLATTLNSVPGRATKGIAEGEEWLKWSGEIRFVYVSAYLTGFDRGFTQGCKALEETKSHKRSTGLPGQECISKEPGQSKTLERYVQLVTEYYTTYPMDRYVTIRTVLDGLSDTRNLTIQQIHQYSGEGAGGPGF